MAIRNRWIRGLAAAVMVIVAVLVVALVTTQTRWFKDWLRGYIARESGRYLNGQLAIGRLDGNLFYGVELKDVRVTLDGQPIIAVSDLTLEYSVFELISRGVELTRIRIEAPVVHLKQIDGQWNVGRLVKRERAEANRSGPSKPITLSDIEIANGSLTIDAPIGPTGVRVPKQIDQLNARLAFKYAPVRFSLDMFGISLRGIDPGIGLMNLSGSIAVRGDDLYLSKIALKTDQSELAADGAIQKYLSKPVFKLKASSERITLSEIARVVPALQGISLQPSLDVALDGSTDRLGIVSHVSSTAGDASVRLTADVAASEKIVGGTVDVKRLNLAPVLANRTDKSDITAHIDGSARSKDWSNLDALVATFNVSAPHVAAVGYTADAVSGSIAMKGRTLAIDVRGAAYGSRVTSAGRLDLPGRAPSSFDLHGHAASVDLRRLPLRFRLSTAASSVTADYHAVGRGWESVIVDATLADTVVAGMQVAAGSTAQFSMQSGRIGYSTDANVAGADLQQIGKAFGIAALQPTRYKGQLNGHIVATGRGTTISDLELQASGTLTDSSIALGRIPQLTFDADIAHDALHVIANGSFADVNPAQASGKPTLAGHVAGMLDVDATLPHLSSGVAIEDVDATGSIVVDQSTVGGLAIDRAVVDAGVHGGLADVRQLDVTARDLNVHANGMLALNETAQSNLAVHADSPNLAELGKLFDQSVAGIAKLDATVTGNKRDLRATGAFDGDGLSYQDYKALTLDTNYTVDVANLSFDTAKLSAATSGTFVTIKGQHVNELSAKTDYAEHQLVFDATAKQLERSVSASGAVRFDTGRNQIVFDRLVAQSGNVKWETAPESRATVRFVGDTITVTDLDLVNGPQQISADGAFGRPGDVIAVTVRNFDLGSADALLLRPLELSGTANGSAEIGGTKTSPSIVGKVDVEKGAFRRVPYESLTAHVNVAGRGMTIDARLEQTPMNWIEAKGYVPRTALTPGASSVPRERTHHEAAAPGDAFDLHIDSSPINVALLAGWTSAVKNVTGTTEAHVHVTGAGDDPHPQGTIAIQEAGFTVSPTGVKYEHVTGRVELEPDRVHITDLEVYDNQNEALSITGDLALHERQVGGVNINVNTRDFKIVDNKFGNVRIDSDLEITGQLTAPRIEGDLAINTGTVNLDPIIEQTAGSAYSEQSLTEIAAAAKTNPQPASASPLGGLEMNVRFTIPNDLVIRGRDLQTPDAPIGLGAVNITVGGDLQIRKRAGNDPIRVVGSVTTVRGTYDFQGRRFTILRDGTVRFEGGGEIDPDLDVTAQRSIQGVEANVGVKGTLKMPQIVLSSVPPLEQAEILSLIVFNQPINQVGAGQQAALTQRAEQLAAGAVAGVLGNSLGQALNLTEFNISTSNTIGNVATVTAGQQVGQNLYVKVEQGFGQSNTTNFILEYELSKWLRLRTNLLQGSNTQQDLFQRVQGSGVDLLFFFRR
jgi:autotransporter translocation and assembly factor TamB